MAKLTTAYVNGLKAQGRRYVVRDDSLVGYEIRVEASGLRTAFVRYTVDGQRRRFKLGRIGEQYTPAEARKDARERLGDVAHGGDPARDRRRRAEAPTFAHVAERFMSEHARPYRKASTADKYQDLLDAHLVPRLGKMPIEDVARADAERIHQALGKETPGQANRVIALLSVIMSKAEAWGYRPMQSNPCYKLPKFKGRKIERYLSGEERARLEASIAVAEAAVPGQEEYVARGAITAIRLLSLTGARSGEIVGLQWGLGRARARMLATARFQDRREGGALVRARGGVPRRARQEPARGCVRTNAAGGWGTSNGLGDRSVSARSSRMCGSTICGIRSRPMPLRPVCRSPWSAT